MARWAAAGAGVGCGVRGPARGVLARGGEAGSWAERGGRKRGKGGWRGGGGWAREGGWAEICFSFSFLFLTLFYLFQFDTMHKQMIN
jgi:hypothetical protein